MEKASDHHTHSTNRFVACSPDQLRKIADRMELASQSAQEKEKITYPITQGIVLYFEPSQKTETKQ